MDREAREERKGKKREDIKQQRGEGKGKQEKRELGGKERQGRRAESWKGKGASGEWDAERGKGEMEKGERGN